MGKEVRHVYRDRRRTRTGEGTFLRGNSGTLTVKAKKVLEGTKIGDSIAVNGVCLYGHEYEKYEFSADVMAETVRRSSLGALQDGSYVNLERAMAADGRFGGHIVSGHIDGTGQIESMRRGKRMQSGSRSHVRIRSWI